MRHEIIDLMRQTVADPRTAAMRLLAMRLLPGAVWPAFGLVIVLGAVLGWLTLAASPPEARPAMMGPAVSPLTLAMMQAGSTLLLAAGAAFGGRLFGGRGDFPGALLLSVWLSFMLVCLQLVQLLLILTAPFLAGILGLAGIALFFWVLTGFVAELHGFRHLGKVFGGIVAGFFLAGVLVLIVFGAPAPVAGG